MIGNRVEEYHSILDCGSTPAESSLASSLPLVREGGPLEALAEDLKKRIFAYFTITIGTQKCIGQAWLRSCTQNNLEDVK